MTTQAPRIGDPRQHTPDETTLNDDGRFTTTLRLKRGCNGCGQLIGDLDDRDLTPDGDLTDVRSECPTCTPEPASA
jgi:hypothetical protein